MSSSSAVLRIFDLLCWSISVILQPLLPSGLSSLPKLTRSLWTRSRPPKFLVWLRNRFRSSKLFLQYNQNAQSDPQSDQAGSSFWSQPLRQGCTILLSERRAEIYSHSSASPARYWLSRHCGFRSFREAGGICSFLFIVTWLERANISNLLIRHSWFLHPLSMPKTYSADIFWCKTERRVIISWCHETNCGIWFWDIVSISFSQSHIYCENSCRAIIQKQSEFLDCDKWLPNDTY